MSIACSVHPTSSIPVVTLKATQYFFRTIVGSTVRQPFAFLGTRNQHSPRSDP